MLTWNLHNELLLSQKYDAQRIDRETIMAPKGIYQLMLSGSSMKVEWQWPQSKTLFTVSLINVLAIRSESQLAPL